MSTFRAILLPGIVLPAEPAYGALIEALGSDVDAVAKDLEVYATPEPAQDYSLEVEIEGVLREADAHEWARFHLVGYSGGGAASLAFAAARAERLESLALLEPAWAGNWDLSPAEKALWVQLDVLEALPVEEFMPSFMRFGLKPGVPLPAPPPGDPPPWMAKRPSGIRAFQRAFKRDDINRESLRRFDRPVYFALGALSNPDQYGEIAKRRAECSQTSSWRCSRSATTSTRHTGWSRSVLRTRSGHSGAAPNGHSPLSRRPQELA
jgi:pimeloyl-ACP methyl ester carboxylesterase